MGRGSYPLPPRLGFAPPWGRGGRRAVVCGARPSSAESLHSQSGPAAERHRGDRGSSSRKWLREPVKGLLGREGVRGEYDPATQTRGASPSCPARLHQGVLPPGCSRAARRGAVLQGQPGACQAPDPETPAGWRVSESASVGV